jgi:putative heme iron utilization protein
MSDLALGIRMLLEAQRVASLGTLHAGEPYVSMVPFALAPGAIDFIIHVSALAAHTKDMLADARVSLLVMAPPAPEVLTQALARLTIQGDAKQQLPSSTGHGAMKEAYLSRFPQSAQMFELADFSIFSIRARSIRFVGGFAQAKTLTPEGLAEILRAER